MVRKKIFLKFSISSEINVTKPRVRFINIYFGTATYDEIAKDEKVTTEAALGLIGGTMGLFTGFSILSGVEILYFVAKYLLSLTRKTLVVSRKFGIA